MGPGSRVVTSMTLYMNNCGHIGVITSQNVSKKIHARKLAMSLETSWFEDEHFLLKRSPSGGTFVHFRGVGE